MPVYSLRARKQEDGPLPTGSKALEKGLKRQIAQAAGSARTPKRDPLAHVNERFMQSVDVMGNIKGEAADGMLTPGLDDKGQAGRRAEKQGSGEGAAPEQEIQKGAAFLGPSSMDGLFEKKPGSESGLAKRFAQTAFQRGNMAAAVLSGSGQMMLFSSLKRTIGQSEPNNLRQRKLFESSASAKRNIAGTSTSKVVFNKGEGRSAVSLVVDVLRDARRSVDELAALAEGGNVLDEKSGAETLTRMYPFLSTSKEREMLLQYQEELADCSTGAAHAQRRLILSTAMKKTNLLIERKQQMKQRFVEHLKQISGKTEAAVVLFESQAFQEEMSAYLEQRLVEPPPEDEDAAQNTTNEQQSETM